MKWGEGKLPLCREARHLPRWGRVQEKGSKAEHKPSPVDHDGIVIATLSRWDRERERGNKEEDKIRALTPALSHKAAGEGAEEAKD
jgi:hypothetical protein